MEICQVESIKRTLASLNPGVLLLQSSNTKVFVDAVEKKGAEIWWCDGRDEGLWNPSPPTDSHHKMAITRRVFQPNILDGRAPAINKPLPTHLIPENELSQSDISTVFDHPRPLGLSPGFDEDGRLVALAIADDTQCRIIEFQHPRRGKKATALPKNILDGRQILQDSILCRPVGDLFAFDMAPLTMSIYGDLDARITNAVDIQSAFPVKNPAADRKPLVAIKAAIGESDIKIREDNIRDLFFYPTYNEDNRNRVSDLAIRAWVSQFLPSFENGAETFEKVTRIDTKKLEGPAIEMIGKLANDSLRLDQKKTTYTTHIVTQSVDAASSELRLSSNNFKTRLRGDRRVRMGVEGNLGAFTVTATMGAVSGRSGNVNTTRNLTDKQIMTVTSMGRDDPTTAEAKRAQSILQYLQGNQNFGPWVQNIWFPTGDDSPLVWPEEWTTQNSNSKPQTFKPQNSKQKKEGLNQPQRTLNPSQQKAVNTMLSAQDDHHIVLVQGPPGTGKTSVISTFVQFAVNIFNKKGIWLVAQSNVAVKNIAERLIKDGFEKWKLLVSKDFHYDWHEHLYAAEIGKHLIRSDEFHIASNKANLQGVHVILCTLSMLSHFSITKFTKEVPLEILVVDEASQIEIGGYFSVFSKSISLRKTCFIGDDKQLPPHGQEDLKNLQSIFEVDHLQKYVVFLDIQYRMPPQIGNIISEAVYDNKLNSNPAHPVSDSVKTCYFIDASGREQPQPDGSFKYYNLHKSLKNKKKVTESLHLMKGNVEILKL
ncbi:unnamed protein product [Cyclocybe aegerita]|uniref:Helicase ATP-binding domain-containing protein n=1 Tax=Cyclocybe aegerita TaxID=1973307 RepID=A0A8S0XWG6_CYCAE|nr:unnamed protein product [Cyclocybe aegerita]